MLKFVLIITLAIQSFALNDDLNDPNAQKIEIRMPYLSANIDDQMCKAFKVDQDGYITRIQALAKSSTVHHISLFGCDNTFNNTDRAWDCNDLSLCGRKSRKGEKIRKLFGWSLDATSFKMPDGIGFKAGPNSDMRYLVMNVHYSKNTTNDHSGIEYMFQKKPVHYGAGMYAFVTNEIAIPPHTKNYYVNMSCDYNGPTLKVFSFRVHTHEHGYENSAYRVRNQTWTLIGKRDTQLPQQYVPLEHEIEIQKGDVIIGRCSYFNNGTEFVNYGLKHASEMCTIYLAFYSENFDGQTIICGKHDHPELEALISTIH